MAAGGTGAVVRAGARPADLLGDPTAAPRRGGRFDLPLRPGEYRYLVRTDGTAALDRVAARLGSLDVTLIDRFEHALTALVVRATPERAAALARWPGVVSVTREVPMHAAATPVSPQGTQTFPAGTGLWGLDRIDQRTKSLNYRFDYANAGVGVLAYVVDTGLHPTHVEFRGRVSLARSYFVPFSGDSSGLSDCDGHGTRVAGALGGTTTGVAKGITIAAVKVLSCTGQGSDVSVIAGLDHVLADRPAGVPVVVNMSLAGTRSTQLNDAVKKLVDAGITVVVASGNTATGGQPACNVSPASAASAITVGATDINDAEASFSNFGSCVDIMAPGVGIRAPYPFTTLAATTTSDTNYLNNDGTSIATPLVSGAIALVLQRNPSFTPAQAWSNLLASATLGAITERTTYNGSPIASPTPDRLVFVEQLAAAPRGVDGMNPFPAPVRFVDTRPTTNGTNFRGTLEQADEATPLAAGEVRRYPMVGVRNIPENAMAMLSVVAVAPEGDGYLTVWPCASAASTRPVVSFLNFPAGAAIANGGLVGIGPEGGICVFASRRTHLVLDVVGWVPPGDTMTGLAPPVRLLDTRQSTNGVDRRGVLEAKQDERTPYAAGTVRRYVLAGAGTLPASGMRAIALNIAAVGATSAGALSAYPCDTVDAVPPSTTAVSFAAGGTVATGAVVVLSADGALCMRSTGDADVVIDAMAWLAAGAGFATFAPPSMPVRLLDTRPGERGSLEAVDWTSPLPAQSTGGTEFVIAGSGGLPLAGVMGSAVLSVTVHAPAAGGFVRVWACANGASTAPTASVLNFRAGVSATNLVISAVDNTSGTPGGICVQVSASVHVSIDASGWFLRSPP